MKKVEEFQETQKLIEEYKALGDKVPEIENKIKQNEIMTATRITRLEKEMSPEWEDEEFNLNKKDIIEECEKQINNLKEDAEKEKELLTKEIEETKDSQKYFRTDANFKTITMEIEAMKEEIRKEEIELSKKDIELTEFYMEENHENPLKWQEIYNEKDEIKGNINALNAKIEEYSKFKEELMSINLTPEEYKIMFEREAKKAKPEETKPAETKPAGTKPAETKPAGTKPAETKPAGTRPEGAKPEGTRPEGTKPEGTKLEGTKPEGTRPEGTKPEGAKPEETKPEENKMTIKSIIIGKEIKIRYDDKSKTSTILDFKHVKNNLSMTKEEKIKKIEKLIGIQVSWEQREKLLRKIDPNFVEALLVAQKDGVSKKEVRSAFDKYVCAIQGKEEAKKESKNLLAYDRSGIDFIKPSNMFNMLRRKKEYDQIKKFALDAEYEGRSKVKLDVPGFIRRALYKNRLLKIGDKEVVAKTDEQIKSNINKKVNNQYNSNPIKRNIRKFSKDIEVSDEVKSKITQVETEFAMNQEATKYNDITTNKINIDKVLRNEEKGTTR